MVGQKFKCQRSTNLDLLKDTNGFLANFAVWSYDILLLWLLGAVLWNVNLTYLFLSFWMF